MTPFFLGFEITPVPVTHAGDVFDPGHLIQTKLSQIIDFLWVIGQQPKRSITVEVMDQGGTGTTKTVGRSGQC